MTQSAQTSIPPKALRLSISKINGELYVYMYIYNIFICKYLLMYIHIVIYMAVFKNKSGPESEKIKKSIQAIGIPGERVENNHPV